MCSVYLDKQIVNGFFQACVLIIGDRDLGYFKAFNIQIFDLQHISVGQDRIVNLQHLTVLRLFLKQIAVLTDINSSGSYHFFTDRIDRRVRHLCKQLFEIIEQRHMALRENRQRCVNTHGSNAFCTVLCHI